MNANLFKTVLMNVKRADIVLSRVTSHCVLYIMASLQLSVNSFTFCLLKKSWNPKLTSSHCSEMK
jgi:hypothetical protein